MIGKRWTTLAILRTGHVAVREARYQPRGVESRQVRAQPAGAHFYRYQHVGELVAESMESHSSHNS
jgi:hypothetical protein